MLQKYFKSCFLLVCVVLLLVAVVSCGTDNTETTPSTEDTTTPSTNAPAEPQKTDRSNEIIEQFNQSIQAASNELKWEPIEAPEADQSFSMSHLVQMLSQLNLKIDNVRHVSDNRMEDTLIILKNGTLSMKRTAEQKIEGSEPIQIPTVLRIKAYDGGIATLNTQGATTTASVQMFPTETEGVDVALLNEALSSMIEEWKQTLESMKMTADSVICDLEKQTYTFSEDYLKSFSNALSKLIVPDDEEAASIGVDRDQWVTELVLDLSGLENEKKQTALVTVKGMRGHLDLSATIINGKKADATPYTSVHVEAKDLLVADLEITYKEENVQRATLTVTLAEQDLKIVGTYYSSAENSANFEIVLYSLDNVKTGEMEITITTVPEKSLSIELSGWLKSEFEQFKTARISGGFSYELDQEGNLKQFALSLSIRGEFSNTIAFSLSYKDTEEGVVSHVSCTFLVDPVYNFYFGISYNEAEMKRSGTTGLGFSIRNRPNGDSGFALYVNLKTVTYSENGAEYEISLRYSSYNEKGFVIEPTTILHARMLTSFTDEIALLDSEKAYLDRCDWVFENQDTVNARCAALDILAEAYLGSSSFDPEKTGFYTVDDQSGIAYVTDIFVTPEGVEIETYVLLDYEDYVKDYGYIKHDGTFSKLS